jgi:hypothetical protein
VQIVISQKLISLHNRVANAMLMGLSHLLKELRLIDAQQLDCFRRGTQVMVFVL